MLVVDALYRQQQQQLRSTPDNRLQDDLREPDEYICTLQQWLDNAKDNMAEMRRDNQRLRDNA
ncbi:hypothetical protein PHLCEN_2v4447 [Hermanssonia centrifuga]|uniref:Uncharacterized protein n=1 Tax=Hermanssonia centrifuga TaxID=98765 RepID=A0A2R6PNL8_9APHY|nr:hypothetical protein PHLCEN_2v4447 [Hermanssonia centrifuga]